MTLLSLWIGRLSRATALLGGLVLIALVLLVCTSVAGRGLNTFAHSELVAQIAPAFGRWLLAAGVGPVQGDFEVLEAGIAVAIFAALPLCQYTGGHATVDIVTRLLPAPLERALIAFWEVVLAVVIVLIGLRLFAGLQSKLGNGQTTFVLAFPVWWSYAASFAACAVAMLVSVFCALARVLAVFTGVPTLPAAGGTAN